MIPCLMVEWISFFFFALAGILHVLFFVLESIIFQKPGMHKLFNVPEEHHATAKLWAFNQGFYNLFLALGTFTGLYFVLKKQIMLAGVLTGFCGLSMIGAGIVLWYSAPAMKRGALVQIMPPLLGFTFLFFHISDFF